MKKKFQLARDRRLDLSAAKAVIIGGQGFPPFQDGDHGLQITADCPVKVLAVPGQWAFCILRR